MSFDPARLPERTQRFLEHGAPKGERQAEAFNAACQCRDAGASEAEAVALVEQGAAACGLPASEARGAVHSAFKNPAREPITPKHGGNGSKADTGKRKIVAEYSYTDEAGKVLFQCVRFEPKDFRQRQPDGSGGWTWNLQGVRLVLYRLPEVLKATDVWITEGEKDCDTLAALGFCATTNPLGAEKWRVEYNEPLRGKNVLVVPDNDAPGRRHAEQVARGLHGVAASVRVLRLPEGVKDVSEYAATFKDKAEAGERLSLLADAAAEWQPTKPETKPSALQIVSAAELLATKFPDADDLVDGILPRMARLILSAPSKLGKTLFAVALMLAMIAGKSVMGFRVRRPLRVLYLQAEVSPRAMQERLRKMLTGFDVDEIALRERLLFYNAPGLKLTNPAHVEAIRNAIVTHKPDVLAFDPLYKYHGGDESSVQDMTAFFDPLDAMIFDYGLSVLLVHHHGKGTGDGLATPAHRNRGSSTIADWADSLLTLTFEDADAGIVKLAFTLRNAEEPEPVALQRNPDTLWFDVLLDHKFASKGSRAKITPLQVAQTIGPKRQVAYSRLVEALRKSFIVGDGTARATIRRATDSGAIRKGKDGLYETT